MHGVHGVCTPCERAMAVDEHGGDVVRGLILKRLDDDGAGLLFISAADLLRRHFARAGNFAVEIIAVRSAERRDAAAGLAEHGRPAAMRVDNAADVRERLVKLDMCGRIGRRVKVALHLFACVHIDEHHVLGAQEVVLHAARLNGHDTAFAVDAADVTPRERDELVFRQQHICLVDFFFQFFQHDVLLLYPVK